MANDKIPNTLNESDVIVLKQMIREVNTLKKNAALRPYHESSRQAPDTYIAMPQECAGIPALLRRSTTGTGNSGTSVGTGTTHCDSPAHVGDSPGSGVCDIYMIDQSDGTLQLVTSNVVVYNLSTSVVPKDWIPVTRDKFGRWLALQSSGQSGLEVIFVVNYTKQMSPYVICNCTVLFVFCNTSSLPGTNADGSIDVVDELGCLFNEEQTTTGTGDLYAGRRGTAGYMQAWMNPVTDCHWCALGLCCPY